MSENESEVAGRKSPELVCCQSCGRTLAKRSGHAIVIQTDVATAEIMGSVKFRCDCGKGFRKSAGYIQLLPYIERWVKGKSAPLGVGK